MYDLIGLASGPMYGTPRSSLWDAVRDRHLRENPCCEVCWSLLVEVHHVRPFVQYPELELDTGNLITLCRPHHFLFGHGLDWQSWIPSVRLDVAMMRERIDGRLRHAEPPVMPLTEK